KCTDLAEHDRRTALHLWGAYSLGTQSCLVPSKTTACLDKRPGGACVATGLHYPLIGKTFFSHFTQHIGNLAIVRKTMRNAHLSNSLNSLHIANWLDHHGTRGEFRAAICNGGNICLKLAPDL